MTVNFDEINAFYYDEAQIEKIKSARIAVAGAGGLGSNCAAALVRAGIENFILVDFDTVSPSNLNRQFFFADQIGRKKVDALAENLRRINPKVNLSLFAQKITDENIDAFFEAADVVVEAFDDAHSKAIIAQRFMFDEKYFVCASGVAGYANSDRLKTRATGKNSWIIGDEVTDVKNAPPLAPSVLICAAKQADKVLELVLTGNFFPFPRAK